ncbi:MAG: hypothetical protein K0M70_02665 [Arenimonas sp.]|nr:hypothetical protein [Arenimonas sp.]
MEAAATALSAEPLVLGWQEAEPTDPEFRRNPAPTDTALAFPESPPDRMRMRRQITGQDVVEGAAQLLGLWPPGYESDPCPRVQRNIANLMTDASASGRERLGEEVRRRRVACRQ